MLGFSMPRDAHSSESVTPATSGFVRTHWSVVLAAGQEENSTQARAALEMLCQAYWKPIYSYVRRRGHNPTDAQDLVQGFFARLLEKNLLADVDPAKGRFRAFLLVALKHFLANEWDKGQAQKRGGGCQIISLQSEQAELSYALEPAELMSADKLFDRRWALTLLERVLGRLEAEQGAAGRGLLFARLKSTLTGGDERIGYAEVGLELGMSEGAIKVAVYRLRQRYRDLLREEIGHTVPNASEVDEEIRSLFAALAGP